MRPIHATRASLSTYEASSDDGNTPAQAVREIADTPAAREARTVMVETIFGEAGTLVRILPPVNESRRRRRGTRIVVAGGALIAFALAVLGAVAVNLDAERTALAAWATAGRDPVRFVGSNRAPATKVLDVLFLGGLLAGGITIAVGLHRRADGERRSRRAFVIGSAAGVDAPVDPAYLPSDTHALVTAAGDDIFLHPTPRMSGAIHLAGETHSLNDLVAQEGSLLRLPDGARARLTCGRTTFVVTSIRRPSPLAAARPGWGRRELLPYEAGVAIALGLFVLMIATLPSDPRSLSFDLLGNDSRLLSFHIAPPVEPSEPLPAWLLKSTGDNAGASAPRASGPSGASGDRTAKATIGRASTRGTPDPRLAKQAAIDEARSAGVLGMFKHLEGTQAGAIFQTGSVFGDAETAANVLGGLLGNKIGSVWGVGGLDDVGTGSGGGGTGDDLLGVGRLKTMGRHGSGPGSGPGYGDQIGRLGRHHATPPNIITGEATVRGSLDKEIVRRIIHRHINEVRFCYEEELRKQPALSGRMVVQFMISGGGQVISSVLQSSSIGNSRVESCTVQAVRRWAFPQPQGGGLVVVSYPFVLAQAG